MRMAICLISLIVALFLKFKTGHCATGRESGRLECIYFIDGLVSDKELSTNSDKGTIILDLLLSPLSGGTHKRRRRGLNEDDLLLVTESSYFNLTFLEGSWALQVQSCLIAGLEETLLFSMNYNHDPDDCQNSTLDITVLPTQPVIMEMERQVVDIGPCQLDGTIDVLDVQFSNSHACVSFTCTVNCTNANKLFWIHADTVVRTAGEDITVSFSYTLHIICQDASDLTNQAEKQGEQFIEVVFTNDAPCTLSVSDSTVTTISASKLTLETPGMTPAGSGNTSPSPANSPTVTISSPSISTQTDDQKPKGFFQKPLHVAIVSAVGGTGVIATAGVISVVLASKRCNFRQLGISEENIGDVEDGENQVNTVTVDHSMSH